MLAPVVLLSDGSSSGPASGPARRQQRHPGDRFERRPRFDRRLWSRPQQNGAWPRTSAHGTSCRAPDRLDQHRTGRALVVVPDLVLRQRARQRNRIWAQVSVRRSEQRDLPSRLRQSRRPGGVGMQRPADRLELRGYSARCVGVSVDGLRSPSTTSPWASRSRTTMSAAVDLADKRRHLAYLEHPGLAIDAADVAPGQCHQPGAERQVRDEHALAQLLGIRRSS